MSILGRAAKRFLVAMGQHQIVGPLACWQFVGVAHAILVSFSGVSRILGKGVWPVARAKEW